MMGKELKWSNSYSVTYTSEEVENIVTVIFHEIEKNKKEKKRLSGSSDEQ